MSTETRIWLTDPAGGGIVEKNNVLVLLHKNLRVIAHAHPPQPLLFNPGELRCTQAALDALGSVAVVQHYEAFLRGEWGAGAADDAKANNHVVQLGRGTIYARPTADTLLISYVHGYSILMLSSEY